MFPVSHFHPRQLPSASHSVFVFAPQNAAPACVLEPSPQPRCQPYTHPTSPCVPGPPIPGQKSAWFGDLQAKTATKFVLVFPTTSHFHPGEISSTHAQDWEWWSKPLAPSSRGPQPSNSRTSLTQYVSPTSTDLRFRPGAIPTCSLRIGHGASKSPVPAHPLQPQSITILPSPKMFHPPPPIFVASAVQYRKYMERWKISPKHFLSIE